MFSRHGFIGGLGGGGGGGGGGWGVPGLGRITSYSRTPVGGHYTYVNQGPGYSHKWVQLFREAIKNMTKRTLECRWLNGYCGQLQFGFSIEFRVDKIHKTSSEHCGISTYFALIYLRYLKTKLCNKTRSLLQLVRKILCFFLKMIFVNSAARHLGVLAWCPSSTHWHPEIYRVSRIIIAPSAIWWTDRAITIEHPVVAKGKVISITANPRVKNIYF